MTIYCIVEEGWDGIHYNTDGVRCFSTEEKRDTVYKRLSQSRSYKNGDFTMHTYEVELDEDV